MDYAQKGAHYNVYKAVVVKLGPSNNQWPPTSRCPPFIEARDKWRLAKMIDSPPRNTQPKYSYVVQITGHRNRSYKDANGERDGS